MPSCQAKRIASSWARPCWPNRSPTPQVYGSIVMEERSSRRARVQGQESRSLIPDSSISFLCSLCSFAAIPFLLLPVKVTCVCDSKAILGEGPYWDVTDQRLYWVDIKGRLIHRLDPATGQDETWATPEVVGSLAVRAKGGLVVALRSGLYFFDLTTSQATPAVLPPGHPDHNRFNDGKVDRQGRFWAGSMDDLEKEPSGGLFRFNTNLDCHQLVDQITISNSLCWSPDGRTLYYSDSTQRRVWAWDFDVNSGQISNRRVFIQLPSTDGVPDGATVDAEGYFWL